MSEESPIIDLNCPGQPWVLPHIRALVCSVATDMGFCEEDVQKIELSVDEACSNAILHGYGESERTQSRISVRLMPASKGLAIEVKDFGTGSADAKPHQGARDLQEYLSHERPHGLGLYIMDRLMDEVEFFFPPRKGTVVTMIKRLEV